ncbi:uncharacterized protein LOC110826900 isoform X2 [Zootermopsis nevadensis]|nr:uncharacterized protein LOC110826900 isoform X2 [Zootermopsis nevadensis]
MNTSEETPKTPEWMLLLESKKKRPHRLAHEIGAGAPCLSCGDACPGLDLHFWRKLCRNCKCKKEEHDVRDDEGYEQFEILFANSGTGKKKHIGAFLNIKVPETSVSVPNSGIASRNSNSTGSKSIAFDWVPPDVSEDVAAQYMLQLPSSKLPISGSDGALYRRQQLEKQVPLHDIDASKCHGLTPDEIKGLQQYLENLKNNVVGQGRVTKVPVLYTEQRVPYSGPTQHQSLTVAQSSVTGESKPIKIATSQSAQSLRSLSSLPLPRPFAPQNYDKNYSDSFPPPPLSDSLPSNVTNLGLKTPSAFFPHPRHVGYFDAPVVADQQAHYLASSTADHSNQGVQYSTELPGRHVAQTFGDVIAAVAAEDGKQYINVPFPTHVSVGQPSHTHARDGTFVSEQQAHEIAFSTQIPVGLVSQHSKALDNAREVSDQATPSEQMSPFGSITENNVPGENKHVARDGVITASRHPAGVLFSANTKTKNPQSTESLSNLLHGNGNFIQDECITTIQSHGDGTDIFQVPSDNAKLTHLQQADVGGNFQQDRGMSAEQYPYNVAYSSACSGQKSSLHSSPINSGIHNVPKVSSLPQCPNNVPSFPQVGDLSIPQDAKFLPYSTNILEQVAHSVPIAGDSLPKSALVMQQGHLVNQEGPEPECIEQELTGKLQQLTGLGNGSSQLEEYHLNCHKCNRTIIAGEVAVLAERAGKQAAWHPQCFVCCTCEELLVDLIYFYHKGDVYCGRHYAELLNIPRCFACDELIFVKEYTCAEGNAFHVKHFCCYECDTPLGGKQYIPKDNQPVCLECFQKKYGK